MRRFMTRGKKKLPRARGADRTRSGRRPDRSRREVPATEAPPGLPSRTLTYPWLLFVVLFAFATRVIYLFVAGGKELFQPLVLDSKVYAETAALIAIRAYSAGKSNRWRIAW